MNRPKHFSPLEHGKQITCSCFSSFFYQAAVIHLVLYEMLNERQLLDAVEYSAQIQ